MPSQDLLPNSLARHRKSVFYKGEEFWELHCANACGRTVGCVSRKSCEALGDFAYAICNNCHQHGQFDRTKTLVPIEVAWAKAAAELKDMQARGRVLTPKTILSMLDDPNSVLSKLARDLPRP